MCQDPSMLAIVPVPGETEWVTHWLSGSKTGLFLSRHKSIQYCHPLTSSTRWKIIIDSSYHYYGAFSSPYTEWVICPSQTSFPIHDLQDSPPFSVESTPDSGNTSMALNDLVSASHAGPPSLPLRLPRALSMQFTCLAGLPPLPDPYSAGWLLAILPDPAPISPPPRATCNI